MKELLAFPDFLGPQKRRTAQDLLGPSPLLLPCAAGRAYLGEAFMAKQKKNEKQQFRNCLSSAWLLV